MGEEYLPRRSRFRFVLAALLLVVAFAAFFLAWALSGPRPGPDLSKPIREIRVSLWEGQGEMRITDPELVRQLVVEPLRRAEPDRNPADYVVVGGLTLEYADGTQDGIILFLPWGRFKYGDSYGIADFQPLEAETRRSLPQAPRSLFDRAPEGQPPP